MARLDHDKDNDKQNIDDLSAKEGNDKDRDKTMFVTKKKTNNDKDRDKTMFVTKKKTNKGREYFA